MTTNNSINLPTGTLGKLVQAQGAGNAFALTTATYPATTTINRILYSSAANVISELATANGGVLTTSATGVPSIDTTNFAVLTTGLQLKGNNANTAPPSGFIGEQISSVVSAASAVTLTPSTTPVNVTSISLLPGIWDVTGAVIFTPSGSFAGSSITASISLTSATNGTSGDNNFGGPAPTVNVSNASLYIPTYRMLIPSTSTVYLVAASAFSVATIKAYGRISATRVA